MRARITYYCVAMHAGIEYYGLVCLFAILRIIDVVTDKSKKEFEVEEKFGFTRSRYLVGKQFWVSKLLSLLLN